MQAASAAAPLGSDAGWLWSGRSRRKSGRRADRARPNSKVGWRLGSLELSWPVPSAVWAPLNQMSFLNGLEMVDPPGTHASGTYDRHVRQRASAEAQREDTLPVFLLPCRKGGSTM